LPPPRSCSSQFPRSPTQRKPVQVVVVAAEAVASVDMSESALGVLLAAVGDLPAVPLVARASVAAELGIARSEPAISRGGPLRRRGRGSQRHASLRLTLQARA